jgi:FkbM family methyltransferase
LLQGALRGKKWTVGSATHGCWLGSYEYQKQSALQYELKIGDVVYDIGANVGFYSLLASAIVGETGHVYSFEPFPENFRELRRHLEMYHIKNCTVIDAAGSSTNGEANFDPPDDRFLGRLAAAGSLRVRIVSLDELALRKLIRPPNLMKIDIERAESECLRGAADVIQVSPHHFSRDSWSGDSLGMRRIAGEVELSLNVSGREAGRVARRIDCAPNHWAKCGKL